MDRPFVHLHVHTEYSLLDGANRCADLAKTAAEMGMPAVAITDHGVMYGCVEFFGACKAQGVNPILGCEVYVAPSGRTRRDVKEQFHLILLAENEAGWRNLVRVVSSAHVDGFYYKPRIDHDLLAQNSEGLIGASACLAGEIPSMILGGDEAGALARANSYRDMLGPENFFLEIQANSLPEQKIVNKALIKMSREHGFPLIATNDAHYLRREDALWHDVMLCVGTRSTIDDPQRFRFSGDDYYFRSPDEMWELFGTEAPDALTNTVAIAERCRVDLPLGKGYYLPNYQLPEGETLTTHLRKMTEEGLAERMGGTIPDDYRERMEYELGVIEGMDFPGYFCIVSDIIASAKKMGIPVGPGRGSAAGSLVAWALKITELDPIKHGLLFERFLNPERISMPDIDTDISDKQRDEVIQYIVDKYGSDHVAQIITFGRMLSRQAVKDVGRAMGIPYADVERVAKLVPDPLKSGIKKISDALDKTPDLKAAYDADPQTKRMLDTASKMEGIARHCSQHAAGIVITPRPTVDMVPVTRIGGDGGVVTQFPMEPVEKLGLVKMDFLGLRTLSIIEGALRNIEASGYEPVDLTKIPMDDPKVFEMLMSSDTLGVFQLESSGMRELIRRLRPDRFEDLVALMALYRPGPLESGMADQYVRRKHGEEPVEFPHPNLSEALAETYGVILYQEQVMQCAARLAGYSLGEADLLRRAMGKKKVEVMAEQRAKFVAGAEANGVSGAKAGEIFDIIEKFAGYGFNKSHSAAYALISYQTAWLKVHYGPEFLASYLSALVGSKMDVLGRYIDEVRAIGIEVEAPDINSSGADFTVSGGRILFGLSGVARVGASAVESILAARADGGPFSSLWDFLTRVDLRSVNRAVVENLIKSGAFRSIEPNRRRLYEAAAALMELASKKEQCEGQKSIFGEDDCASEAPELPDVPDYCTRELLALEHETMGIYISGHPFGEYEADARAFATCSVADLEFWRAGEQPSVMGLLADYKEKYTKKGAAMGILTLEDATAQTEVVCFPSKWAEVKPLLAIGEPYVVTGNLRDDGKLSFLLEDIKTLPEAREGARQFRIQVDAAGAPDAFYDKLWSELDGHRGDMPVLLDMRDAASRSLMRLRGCRVADSPELRDRILSISMGCARAV